MNKLPFARTENIVVQEFDKEFLIYDLLTHKAYHLNETASLVYKACDGKTAFGELKIKTRFTDEVIFLALDELKKENLIAANDSYSSPFAGMTRRQVIRRVGLASMIALPVISALVAPTAAMAQSISAAPGSTANCQPCKTDAECASGNCVSPNTSGSPDMCSAGSSTTTTYPSGFNLGTFPGACSIIGASECCSGSAANAPSGFCICN